MRTKLGPEDDARVAARIKELEIPGYGEDEVLFLSRVLRRYRPTHVFEWGTNRGSSARVFYEAGGLLGLAFAVHSVELPEELAHLDRDYPGRDHATLVRGLPIALWRGDGLDVALGLVRELRPSKPLFFVDGDHSTESVRRELDGIARSAPAAPIVLHDSLHLDSVRAAIDGFLAAGRGYRPEELRSQAGMTALWP